MTPADKVGFDALESSRQYYGEELTQTGDLKTSACCTIDSIPGYVRDVLPSIHAEILNKYYGCGTAFPPDIKDLVVLDLGCGTGRDSYVMSKITGAHGFVHGIDMTAQQIAVAKKHTQYQAEVFGYETPNTAFVHDIIENIDRHYEPESMDLITSNCVLNLLADKEPVIRKAHTLLKTGGEFYFSDVYVDRRLSEEARTDHVLHGECLGGALYEGDFLRIARRAGFADPRLVSNRQIEITDENITRLAGNASFYSKTYRLWKLEGLEDAFEDFGHVAVYKGGHPQDDSLFALDAEHIFEKELPERICGNTALMLEQTRLAEYFDVSGNFSTHFGLFSGCGTSVFNRMTGNPEPGCGC